jgi:2-methylcitrate dehydratase PrpD
MKTGAKTSETKEMTRDLARFCAGTKYEDLSPEAVDRAKYFAMDFIGVAARGSLEASSKTMYRFLEELCPAAKGGVIIGTKDRAPHQYAALANGTSSHSLEMDDVSNEASLHPGVAIFPAALAACEMAGKGAKRFIEGAVLGYEVMIRLGKALGPKAHYAQGFHPTGTCGTFGATVTAAHIFGLTEAQTVDALGIAGSQAAGSMEFLAQGAWTKRMHPGWAAHNGIIASLLAKKGFKGPSTILEGRDGFLHAYSPSSNHETVMEGLGRTWAITRTSIKPHSCCRYMQGPIDGILSIMKENGLGSADIGEVTLGILKAGFPIIAEPESKKRAPKSVVDAQFSMPFGAAVAILFGEASLDQFRQERVDDPRVKEIMKRVRCVEDSRLDPLFPKQWPASVQVQTKRGKSFTAWVEYPKGDPENALSWEELTAKFERLTVRVYTKERARKIARDVRGIEKVRHIAKWSALLFKDR